MAVVGAEQFLMEACGLVFSIGQFAGQGVPFKHCHDAPEGSAITSNASAKSQLHTLRLSVCQNLIASLISVEKIEKFPCH